MALLASTSVASYGTFTFPVEHNTTASISPTYDPADRTVIFDTYQVIIDTELVTSQFAGVGPSTTSPIGLDTVLNNIQKQLSQPGDTLVLTGKGLGDIRIPDLQQDVKWGPKPRLLQWQPLASNQACRVRWQVEFCIPRTCDTPSYKGLVHLNYTPTFSVDKVGYATRTINGTFSIAMSRANVNARNVPDSADNYIDQVIANFPVPQDFHRTTSQRTISLDKRECNFTIVDTHLWRPYPFAVSDLNMHYSTHSLEKTFSRNMSTLSATFTLRNDVPKKHAVTVFFREVEKRWANQEFPQGVVPGVRGASCFIPISYTFDENVYGPEVGRLSFTWSWVINTDAVAGFQMNLSNLLPGGAVWLPVAGGRVPWQTWAASMAPVWRPGGLANLKDDGSRDMIIDLCDQTPGGSAGKSVTPVVTTGEGIAIKGPPIKSTDPTIIYGMSMLRAVGTTNVIMHKPLPKQQGSLSTRPPPSTLTTTTLADLKARSTLPDLGLALAGRIEALQLSLANPDIVQRRTTPTGSFWLTGGALRAAFPVPLPVIRSFGGSAVEQLAGEFVQQQVANLGGIPIFAAAWNFLYAAPSLPSLLVPVPENLAYQLPERDK